MRTSALAALGAVALGALGGCGGSGSRGPNDAIAFVSTRDGAYQIYTSAADGSGQDRLTKDEGGSSSPNRLQYETDPAWSRDGKRIAFASARDGQLHLFVIDAAAAGEAKRLTSGPQDDRHPTWSPDGRRLAFTRGSPNRIDVVGSAGGDARPLIVDVTAEEDDPAWSPDGRWIAYDRRTPGTASKEIWIVHPDGSGRRQVTRLGADSTWPSWSPDSRRIAFSSDVRQGRYAIYTVGIRGTALTLVSVSSADAIQPSWSPDGKRIAYSRDGAIVTVDPDGQNEKVITDAKNNDSSPVWNPALASGKGG